MKKFGAVERLLKNGADTETKDGSGATPLMYAALHCDAIYVNLLLENGADINATDDIGGTPLMYSVANENAALMLIRRGADISAVDADGWSAYDYAVMGYGYGDVSERTLDALSPRLVI
jgi:ankyrin repeat protein